MIERYKPALLDLFKDAQRLRTDPKDVALCASIQERLIRRISRIESRIQAVRRETQEVRNQLSAKREGANARAEAHALKKLIESQTEKIEEYSNLLYVFKTVGDAIAFTYLNRWDIKPLSAKESAGFISGKSGSRFERHVARRAWSRGFLTILNDLTNCIRYADITVSKNGSFLLVELKKSQNISPRGKRQLETLASMSNYLETDQIDRLFGDPGPTIRASMHAEELDHCEVLNSLIEQARGVGYAFTEVEAGMFYFVGNDDHGITNFFDFAIPKCRSAPVICCVNDSKFTGAGYSPFTLSITDPTAAFDFWAGRLLIIVLLDRQEIREAFARRGHRVEFDFGGDRPLKIFTASVDGDEDEVSIGSHMLSRLFTEFLSLNWMIDALVHVQSEAFKNADVEIRAAQNGAPPQEDNETIKPP